MASEFLATVIALTGKIATSTLTALIEMLNLTVDCQPSTVNCKQIGTLDVLKLDKKLDAL
ncbi:MAG: hypothetical protein F6K65_29655 [Moorea sp. SIO3C2]|nr:hypothetical protein [Moorena sp. SIO3C2]